MKTPQKQPSERAMQAAREWVDARSILGIGDLAAIIDKHFPEPTPQPSIWRPAS